jgi:hypothetical protein
VYYSLGVSHCGWLVEALSESVFDEGPRCGVVSTDPAMDVPQQPPSLLDGDAALQDLGVTLLVEFSLNDDKGLSMAHKPSGLHFICPEDLTNEAIKIGNHPVGQMVGLCYWVLINLHDLRVRRR